MRPEWVRVPPERIETVPRKILLKEFGNGGTDTDVRRGLKLYKPYRPSPKNNLRFFFIYRKEDINICYRLYRIFLEGKERKDGEKKYDTLAEFICQPFKMMPEGSIVIGTADTALDEVRQGVMKLNFLPGYEYMAICATPFGMDEKEGDSLGLYARIEELLLKHRIVSMAIDKEKLYSSDFGRCYLPDIMTELLGKIGGTAWRWH
ncbi:MAG: hypothetical protein LUE99_12530 [Bacteroides sp.]|nr:hypothetical protein [Bacteroides sp.]